VGLRAARVDKVGPNGREQATTKEGADPRGDDNKRGKRKCRDLITNGLLHQAASFMLSRQPDDACSQGIANAKVDPASSFLVAHIRP